MADVYHVKWTIELDCTVAGMEGDTSQTLNERIAERLSDCLKDLRLSGPVTFEGHTCRMVPKGAEEMN